MNDNSIMPPLSSRMFNSKSIPILFHKINHERNSKGKRIIKNYSCIDYETPNFHNNNSKLNFRKKLLSLSKFSAGQKLNLLDNTEFHQNIYQDRAMINAPSLNNNLSEIKQMIKDKKYQNFKNIYNMFFDSPLNNEYIKEFNKNMKRKLIIHRKNNFEQFKRNNSCEDLMNSKIKIKNQLKNDDSIQRLSTNCSKILNSNFNNKNAKSINTQMSKKQTKNDSSNLSITRNQSLVDLKFPERKSISTLSLNDDSKNSFQNNIILPKIPITNKQSNYQEDKPLIQVNLGCFITELKTDKMKFSINELIKDKSLKREKIDIFEERIFKLKLFQAYQRERLEKILYDKKFEIQERIDFIIKIYKMYEKIYVEYINNLKNYNLFLFNTSNKIEIEMRNDNKLKRDIFYEIEIILGKLIDKQKKLEYLIKTRNFLFKVKNKDKKIIKLNNQYVYKVSKRKNLIDKLCELFGRDKESLTYKYLKELIPLEELEKVLKLKPTKSRLMLSLANTIKKTLKLDEKENDLLSPPSPGEKIFETPEEFIGVFENLKNSDLELMQSYEQIVLEKNELIDELNNDISLKEEGEQSDQNIKLKKGIESLKEEREKNLKLTEKYEIIEDLAKVKKLSSLKSGFKIYSYKAFNNIYYYNLVKYNKLRAIYKFGGLVLLEKLINNVNEIILINNDSKIFNLNDIYHYVPESVLVEILKTTTKDFNQKNQFLIKEYTLKLIKLYEFFAEYIMNKNRESKKRDIIIYNKYREKVINERKIINSKILKSMSEQKRNSSIKELLEKWNKRTVKNKRKSDIEINRNSDENIKNKKSKKNIKYFYDKFENSLLYEE